VKSAFIKGIRALKRPEGRAPTLTRKIKIRAAHEVMAAWTTQLALFVDQFMPALRTKPPVLAGNVIG
jgi:membrane protein DedA with SNARE-associated domain